MPISYGPDPVTGFSYSCDVATPNIHFTDVPASNTFCKHIHYLWAKGIIGGCGATTYCPNDTVTRDEMAKFLTNGFNATLWAIGHPGGTRFAQARGSDPPVTP